MRIILLFVILFFVWNSFIKFSYNLFIIYRLFTLFITIIFFFVSFFKFVFKKSATADRFWIFMIPTDTTTAKSNNSTVIKERKKLLTESRYSGNIAFPGTEPNNIYVVFQCGFCFNFRWISFFFLCKSNVSPKMCHIL